jgi:hypothetical protein
VAKKARIFDLVDPQYEIDMLIAEAKKENKRRLLRQRIGAAILGSLGLFLGTIGIATAGNFIFMAGRGVLSIVLIYHAIKLLRKKRTAACPYCENGNMEIVKIKGYPKRFHRIHYVVLEAHIAQCCDCEGTVFHAREYKRWEKEFYQRYTGNLVKMSGWTKKVF